MSIPRLIHLIYLPWGKDQQLLSDCHNFDHRPYDNMVCYADGFEVRLWTYDRVKAFCSPTYPAIWKLVHTLARPTMMVDVLRWLVVYHFGGIYWQYDMNPLVPMDRMLPAKEKGAKVFTEFVNDAAFCRETAAEPIRQGEPEEALRVLNQCFSARIMHPFIKGVLDLILERCRTLTPHKDYDVLYICANAAVSTAYDRFGKHDSSVELATRDETRAMMKIQYRGTWRTDPKIPVIPSPPSVGSHMVGAVRRCLKSIPIAELLYHRYVRPHVHETIFREHSPRDEYSGLTQGVKEWVHTFGLQSILEWSFRESFMPSAPLSDQHLFRRTLDRSSVNYPFMNPMYSHLPRVDAVVMLDYFDYLNFEEVLQVLCRLRRAGIRYLIATNYPCLNSNWDTVSGDWRPVSLALPPFSLSDPLADCPSYIPGGRSDRCAGIFRL